MDAADRAKIIRQMGMYSQSEQQQLARTESSLEKWARTIKEITGVMVNVAKIMKEILEMLDRHNRR
ncbi:hypothetical protein ACFOY4_02915 [Actinomadura syzygii]|uniref:Uncharacterized protein n=1 Tax=Actinomadura syzygii TaxID=1427538 RepID=A0A5D0UIL1_9ACTN|nr:hypothetical protein [Actinomadura syzygii]TYC17640.1 hypothetical protein FXF65_06545 [Actinomadura syzygii]